VFKIRGIFGGEIDKPKVLVRIPTCTKLIFGHAGIRTWFVEATRTLHVAIFSDFYCRADLINNETNEVVEGKRK